MSETTAGGGHGRPRARILIVDADPGTRQSLAGAVTGLGHTACHAAEPGTSAVELAAGQIPDLALIGLGPTDATEPALEAGEQIASRFGVPIVYLTEVAEGPLVDRMECTGPHGYVLKPVDARQLGLSIRAALHAAALERTDRERHGSDWAGLRDTTNPSERRAAVLEYLFNQVRVGVIVADRDGEIEAVNPAAREIFATYDAPFDESRFRHFAVYHADGRTPFAMEDLPLSRAVDGQSTEEVLMLLRHRFPETEADTWLSAAGYPLLGPAGERAGGAVILRDVTAAVGQEAKAKEVEAELHERVQVLDAIIRSMGDGVVVADADARLTLFNPSAERILGMGVTDHPPEEWSDAYGVFYADAATLVPTEDLPLVRAGQGESVEDMELFIRNSGVPEGVYINVYASPLRNEAQDVVGGVAVFRDVSQRRMETEALTQAFAHGRLEVIDTVLHNIGNAINSVATGAGTLHAWFEDNELIRRFRTLSEVVTAHEGDWTSWIENDAQGRQVRPFLLSLIRDLTTEHERLLKTSTRVRERVRHIVDIIRTQASFTDGSVERQVVHLSRTIDDVVKVLQESLGRRDLRIEVNCSRAPAEILVQESRFQQMLVNLLKNAIEATDERAARLENHPDWRPMIRLTAHRSRTDGNLVIHVFDNGIGIDPSRLKAVFNAGYTTKPAGTGLGLHSAANFVIGAGGSIRASSNGVGHGTTMRVTLRIAERPKELSSAEAER